MLRGDNRHTERVPNIAPEDRTLLQAGGWGDVADAVVLAKGYDGDFCAALINTHGGDESSVYFTIAEAFARQSDGSWLSLGHTGPVGRGGGSGWHLGGGRYEYTWADPDGWQVVVVADR